MRELALLLLAVTVVVLVRAAPAGAIASTATIVAALERDPLYVDPSFDDVLTPPDRRAIRAAIRAQPGPVYVAVVPLRDGDRFDGDERAFLTAVAARIGRPDAGYVAFADFSPVSQSDDDALQRRLYLADDVARDTVPDGPLGDQLVAFLDALRAPDLQARYDAAQARQAADAPDSASGRDFQVPVWLLGMLGLVVLAVAGGVVTSRRRGARPGAPPLLPDRVFEYARAARFDELRERTRTEVIALSETIDAQPTPTSGPALASYERAVECASAASKLHDRASRTVELAGVLVLVDGGREALRAAADARAGRPHAAASPLCFFDPRHGRADRPVRFVADEVAACRACATAVEAGRDPAVLREDGRPWFEREGALAESGMGQFTDLAPRLARGDAP